MPVNRMQKMSGNGKKSRWWILAAIAVVAVAVVVVAVLLKQPDAQSKPIKKAKDAIELLQSRGGDLGYKNALSELTELHTSTVDGDKYYRLQQNYRGIPVYGRTVVCVTNKRGNVVSVAPNVRDIPGDLVLTPSVTKEQAESGILTYLRTEFPKEHWAECPEFTLNPDSLCIYDLDGPASLVYETTVGNLAMLIDAQSGKVLHVRACIVPDQASFLDSGEEFNALKAEDGNYVLKDEDTGVYMYTAEGRTYWDIGAEKLNIKMPIPLVSEDNIFGNEDDHMTVDRVIRAEAILNTINDIGGFFDEFNRLKALDRVFVVFDDGLGDPDEVNAGGGYGHIREWIDGGSVPDLEDGTDPMAGFVILGNYFSQNIEEHINTLAHEYTHAVTGKYVGWVGNGKGVKNQNGAINEAYSDIFGELYEAYVTGGEPDWVHGHPDPKFVRNLKDPTTNGYPSKLGDAIPENISYTHGASTMISHIACKMAQGDPENPETKIPTKELGELWYRAMLLMNADADFADCRLWIMEAARQMGLSRTQREWIAQAFDDAGIRNTVVSGTRVDVYSIDMKMYEDYDVTVTQTVLDSHWFSADTVVTTFFEVDRFGASFRLNLPKGMYRVTIGNRRDPSQIVHYDVEIVESDGGDQQDVLPVYTDFLGEKVDTVGYSIVRWDRSRLDQNGKSTENYYFDYIVLEGDTPAIKKINDELFAKATEFMNDYETGEELASYGMGNSGYSKARCEVTFNRDGVIGIRIVKDEYTGGNTSHGSFHNFYYSLNTGETATLSEMLGMDETELVLQLRKLAWDALQDQFGVRLFDGVEAMISSMELEDFDYSIKNGQVYLYFSQYSVVDGTFGEVSIPIDLYLDEE